MKKIVYTFNQMVLGLPFLNKIDETEYNGRIQKLDDDMTKIVVTTKEDMTSLELSVLDEYEENKYNYEPTISGNLF